MHYISLVLLSFEFLSSIRLYSTHIPSVIIPDVMIRHVEYVSIVSFLFLLNSKFYYQTIFFAFHISFKKKKKSEISFTKCRILGIRASLSVAFVSFEKYLFHSWQVSGCMLLFTKTTLFLLEICIRIINIYD